MTYSPLEPMVTALSAAVPLYIMELQQHGGPNDLQWEWARSFADELGAQGDILQFGGARKGEAAIIFNRLAYAMAILSFLPGGIRFADLHFAAGA